MTIISSSGEAAGETALYAEECGGLPETSWLMRIWTLRGIGVKVYEEISEQTPAMEISWR